jgi:hypothetical protein
MASQHRYNVDIWVNLKTGQLIQGRRELDRVLGQLSQGELARSRKLDADKLNALRRANQESVREHQRAARNAQRQYDEHLGSGFFSRLARGSSNAFNRNFSVSGAGIGGGGGGGLLNTVAGVAGGNIAANALMSVLGGVSSAVTSGIGTGFGFNRTKEQALLAFEIKLRGKEEAQKFFDQVNKFAEDAPLELHEVLDRARSA